MYLKFEHRVLFSPLFQKDVYINMSQVYAVEILRTKILFRTTRAHRYYWVPRTETNMKELKKYFETEKYK